MRYLIIFSGVVCLAFMLLPSCAPQTEEQVEPVAEEAPSTEADVEAINDVNRQCLEALNAGDMETYVSFFAQDVVWMPPNEPAVTGMGAIESWVRPLFDQFTYEETWSSEELVVFGDWAFDRGSYTMTATQKEEGEVVEDMGKHIYIFKRQPDGNWRYARLISNSDSPLPEEPTT